MPESGQVVGGRYRLVRPLGEGGMASVWAAEHMTMGNIVAVKIISPELLKHEVAIARFNREARAAAKLRSPYVVQIFDHDVDQAVGPYIAMELLEGESLADRLDRERTVAPPELVRIMLQVGKGLMRAHAAGIVHRDLKPDNIFLTVDEDDGEIAKVLDFGVAKADSPLNVKSGGNKTVEGTLLGTLNYMSPEQAQGREVNHLTDLWALGVIAFEALVGRRPFDEDAPGALVLQICAYPIPTPSQLNPNIPGGFDEWFAKACNRTPSERFQSAQDLTRALADVCDAEQLSIDDLISIPMPKPISEEVIRARPPEAAPAPSAPRKRRVLEIVDTMPPPAPDGDEPERGIQVIPSDPPVEIEIDLEPEPEYYVRLHADTVGPLQMEALRSGFVRGHLAPDAFVWSRGWPGWKRAGELLAQFSDKPGKPIADGILLLGAPGQLPSDAPPVPAPTGSGMTLAAAAAAVRKAPKIASKPPAAQSPRSASKPPAPAPSTTLRAGSREPVNAPVSVVRTSPGKGSPKEPSYYLTDGKGSVGPVRASMLRKGIEQGKVPEGTMVWREGWDEWKAVSGIQAELQAWKPAPAGMLRNRPGLEAIGMKSLPPPTAPPSVAPNRREHLK